MKAKRLFWGLIVASVGSVVGVALAASDKGPAPTALAEVADGPRDPALERLLARHRATAVDRIASNR